MPENHSPNEPARPPTKGTDGSGGGQGTKDQKEKTLENWFAGVGAGLKGVFHKLLEQAPPEVREKVIDQIRSHGPGSAAIAVDALLTDVIDCVLTERVLPVTSTVDTLIVSTPAVVPAPT